MSQLSSRDKLVWAISRGYRVQSDGSLFGPRGALKLRINSSGYSHFYVKHPTQSFNVETHRLAAYQEFGDALFVSGVVVRHLDGNALNNAIGNLALGTQSQNSFDRSLAARRASAIHAASHLRKLSDAQLRALREDYEQGLSHKNLQVKYGIARRTVFYALSKTRPFTPP